MTTPRKKATPATLEEMRLKQLGAKIRILREGRNLSQGELGAAVSISGAAICRYETGSRMPDAAILFRMEKVLHCPEYTLVNFLKPVG